MEAVEVKERMFAYKIHAFKNACCICCVFQEAFICGNIAPVSVAEPHVYFFFFLNQSCRCNSSLKVFSLLYLTV